MLLREADRRLAAGLPFGVEEVEAMSPGSSASTFQVLGRGAGVCTSGVGPAVAFMRPWVRSGAHREDG